MDENEEINDERSDDSNRKWRLFKWTMPRSEIVYFVQVALVYIVVITAVVNLTIGRGDNKLWLSLLTGHLGYLLPAPKLKKKK